MTTEQHAELRVLDAEERAGKTLTGAEKGRLADLRRAEILMSVKEMFDIDFKKVAAAVTQQLPKTNPATADREIR